MTEQDNKITSRRLVRNVYSEQSSNRRGKKNVEVAKENKEKARTRRELAIGIATRKSAITKKQGNQSTGIFSNKEVKNSVDNILKRSKKIAANAKKAKKSRSNKGFRFNQPPTNGERILKITSPNGNQKTPKIPEIEKDVLRVIVIGGNEEVGRNMVVFEYGTGKNNSDIVIVDIGMQFPEEDMPGIDYIVPNISYLRGKEKRIRGVIFTHGHLDHIGAAPIVLRQLGYPPVISRDLTLALIKKKVEDGNPGASKRLKTISIKDIDKKLSLGMFRAKFFEVEHSIMDSMGVALETPVGTLIHLGDWTISHDPADGKKITYEALKELKAPRILLLESLGSVKTGTSSEKIIQGNLESLIRRTKGRIILTTFASQIKRINLLLEFCQKIGRKVALDGYSMRTNVEIAKELGYIKVSKDILIPINDIHKYKDNEILVLCTGAQGEHNAAISKMVTEHHRFIKIQKNDTIVFSSSVIPGNERSVQRLKDNLYRKCDNVIHSDIMDIHMGGHSNASDIQEVIKMVEPQYFLPVYANHFFLKESVKRAVEIGFPKGKSAVLDNGHILEFSKKGAKLRKEKADTSYVFVDGLGVGDVGHMVLRDRQALAEDGMYTVTVLIRSKSKKVVNMQITSRGFIFVKDNFDIVNETKQKVIKIVANTTSEDVRIDPREIELNIREEIGEYLFKKTERRPMILPVVIEV